MPRVAVRICKIGGIQKAVHLVLTYEVRTQPLTGFKSTSLTS